eukprot:403342373
MNSQFQQQFQQQQNQQHQQQTSDSHQQYVWSHAYRECALYNRSVKSQIDRENKIFNRDYSRGNEKKKFINIFEGMDNTKPYDLENLKQQTFKDIFQVKNREVKSIKRSINYSNYTKQDHDIISQQEIEPCYNKFRDNIYKYEEIKPPIFDLAATLKQVKKRQKATLDKQSKKYIIKNIKTCSDFARTQREKIKKTLGKKNGHMNMTIQTDDSINRLKVNLNKNREVNNSTIAYDNFLDDSQNNILDAGNRTSLSQQVTPGNLRNRRLQIMQNRASQNRTAIKSMNQPRNTNSIDIENHHQNDYQFSLSKENKPFQNQEPIAATFNTINVRNHRNGIERPGTGIAKRENSLQNSGIKQQLQSDKLEGSGMISFHRKIKSSIGTRRPLQMESLNQTQDQIRQENQVPENRFRIRMNMRNENKSPLRLLKLKDFNTIQNEYNPAPQIADVVKSNRSNYQQPHDSKSRINLKREIVNKSENLPQPLNQAEQMKKRSLSSYCKKRPISQNNHTNFIHINSILQDQRSRKYSQDLQSQISEKIQQAYDSTDKNAKKRLANLQKFISSSKTTKDSEALGYAVGYLDKLQILNNFEDPQVKSGLLLGDYKWNNSNLLGMNDPHANTLPHLFDLDGTIDQNLTSQQILGLQEEEILIDKVLFERKNSKKAMLINENLNINKNNYNDQQQGDNKFNVIENQLIQERSKRKELEAALERLSVKIKDITKKQAQKITVK